MRTFPQTIQTIVHDSGLNLNRISQASGVSNGYLAKLFKGKINRPGKDKVTSLLLALNYTISEINTVLSGYDYQPLHVDDIPAILKNNRSRKISGGHLPQYNHIYFDLLLIALERLGGKRVLVKNRPSGVFMPHALYLQKEYPYEANDAATTFRYRLTQEILKERREIFLDNCEKNSSETFICKTCFAEYLERHISSSAKTDSLNNVDLVVKYIANALSLCLKKPKFHKIYFMERCPYLHFLLQDADGISPKISYPGRKLHHFKNEQDRRMLEGFTTDMPRVVAHFREEIEMCRKAVTAEQQKEESPAVLKQLFLAYFQAHEMAEALERQLAWLMSVEEIRLY